MTGNKDFPAWSDEKTSLHTNKQRPFFHIREVWFCTLGVNIGYEQDGRGKEFLRPILVIRKFNNEVLWGVPLTTNQKTGKYYFSFQIESKSEKSTAILSQLRLIDAKRLQYKVGVIEVKEFELLKTKLRQLLA
jgi:mRNA interferase MazF